METKTIVPLIFIFLGLFVPYWPLALCGVLWLAFSGTWFIVLLGALLLDVAFGPQTGTFHLLVLPFTACAALACFARLLVLPFLRPRLPWRI
ncbi:MAG: hypothetical protein WCI89_01400 [bacterium]